MSFRLGPHAGDVSALTSGGPKLDANAGAAEAAQRWEFDAETGTLLWQIAKLSAMDRPAALNGTWLSRCVLGAVCPHSIRSVPHARPAMSVQVQFSAPLINLSGQRVTSLKLLADNSSPFKGVRPMLRSGSIDFRWA